MENRFEDRKGELFINGKKVLRAWESVRKSDPRAERVPPRLLNRLLYSVSLFEHKTLGRLPMPFGTSLMIIGGPA